jgi:hypothetical protein
MNLSSADFLMERYEALHREIEYATEKTEKLRKDADLLMNSSVLDVYFGYAFDHFSRNPIKPFNFLTAAFDHDSGRSTFSAQVIRAAIFLRDSRRPIFASGTELLHNLVPLIASSIALDVCRNDFPQKGTEYLYFYETLILTSNSRSN